MSALDPKFAKILALMRSTQHAGEQRSARARAEAVAAAAGMTFDEAVALADAKPAAPSIFSGFDDYMEQQEPGWKARRAAEDAERRRKNLAKRAAVIAKYGTPEAALEPCERERLILAAVAPWRKRRAKPDSRWTDRLDGWAGYGFERDMMPAHVLAAITGAYPIPTSFAEAKAEHDHWHLRDDELGLILDTTGLGYGDTALDIAVGVRAEIVRDLVEKDMPVTTIEDLHTRFALYRDNENHDDRIEEALFRDLSTIVETRHLSAEVSSNEKIDRAFSEDHSQCPNPSTVDDLIGRIRAVLDADHTRSDRHIARTCGCSPTTVGKIRREMGLQGKPRSVQRGGQMYQMNFAFAGGSHFEGGGR